MKNKWLIANTLIVALIITCVAGLFATWQGVKMAQGAGVHLNLANWSVDQVNAEATDEKQLKVSGPASLTLETYQGNITVEAGKDNQVTIKTKTTTWGNSDADAQAALKDIKVIIDQHENNIKISIEQAVVVDMLHIGPRGGQVDFTITVPAQTAVMLNSTEGNLSLTGTKGAAKLTTLFGNINIKDVIGEIKSHTSNGEISAQNIGPGDGIDLSSEFGAISVDSANGLNVTISTSNGELGHLKNIHATGLLKITSEFGNIQIVDGDAKTAEIRSNNGAIDLENINVRENLTVKSDFGNLKIKKVSANLYKLNTNNGKIELDGIQNTVKAHSDFGNITVLNAQNATIDLSSNNGAIRFSGSLGSGPHSIDSDFGNILLTLPAESALTLGLKTTSGKITSNFSITVNGTIDSNNWNGTINGGGATLTVKTQNGNINLQSAK